MSCDLKANETMINTAAEVLGNWCDTGVFSGPSSLALTGAVQSASPLTVLVDCRQTGTDSMAFTASLTLIKVGSLG
ncbi:hypothetical protein JOD67_000363 [Tenggerimyces flavus]|nr:hypothetical protein [Tenggerimyces flavus]